MIFDKQISIKEKYGQSCNVKDVPLKGVRCVINRKKFKDIKKKNKYKNFILEIGFFLGTYNKTTTMWHFRNKTISWKQKKIAWLNF